jgi:flavin reductase (DIM6/NTAB) family NADH-FMN oxidoreductase RutF
MSASAAARLSSSADSHFARYGYAWPTERFNEGDGWELLPDGEARVRHLPESMARLAQDSRWPAFFPSPISLVTTGDGELTGLEKVVGAAIVNRFPYIVALSFCRESLSKRHYARRRFMKILESTGVAAVQFLPPGDALDRAMDTIAHVPDAKTETRLAASGLPVRRARTNDSPVFASAFMVYEARLVNAAKDLEGQPIFTRPWVDVGSHRIYFLEITAIQLREDIADGCTQVHWRSLPTWRPQRPLHRNGTGVARLDALADGSHYVKPYTPDYRFPSAGTIGFEPDERHDGMGVKHLPLSAADQIDVDNDRSRWPCFFPSSVGLITGWAPGRVPNLMPCGSTTIVSRQPLVISPCVSYAAINERYAPRVTLDIIRETRRFGCGVPFIDDVVLSGIKYAGNVSLARNPRKVADAGFEIDPADWAPVLTAVPVHFDCQVIGEVRLGTHIMFLGEVKRIRVRADVGPDNPIQWCPWAQVPEAAR